LRFRIPSLFTATAMPRVGLAVAATALLAATATSSGVASSVTVRRSCSSARTIAPGVSLRRCTARLSNLASPQDVFMVTWTPGDPRISLAAQPLAAQQSGGSIPITTTSRWATETARPGLVAALNGDFFTYAGGSAAIPSGLLVHNRAVLWFGAGTDEQAAGYAPRGRVVLGAPRAVAQRLELPTGSTLTVGAWGTNAGHRDQVGVIGQSGPYTPPAGYLAVALGSNPFATSLTGDRTIRNAHGVNRMEHVRRFVIDDITQPNVTDRVPVTFPAAATTSVTIPSGGVGLVYRSVGVAATGFAAIATMSSPSVVVTQPDAAWAAVTDVMAGKPILVKQGVGAVARPANTTSDQWYAEQWRPAIATRRDGRAMLLIAGSSTGASTTGAQFARLLVAFGARDALQFDNRSSTELYRPHPSNGSCSYAGICKTEWNWERDIPAATMLYSHR
jgi:Phosphodiester glycosidase